MGLFFFLPEDSIVARRPERFEAKKLYIEDGLDLGEIGKRLNVPEATVRRWRLEDREAGTDWDQDREQIRMTSLSAYRETLKIAIDKLKRIATSGEIDVKEADAIVKIIKAAKSLYKDVDNLGNILLAMTEFTDFLAEREPDLLTRLRPYLSEFGTTMQRKYSKK